MSISNENRGFSSGSDEFYDDFAVSDFQSRERFVYRENKKYSENNNDKNSQSLKKIAQKHNGNFSSPNMSGGVNNTHITDQSEKIFKGTPTYKRAIISIPVSDCKNVILDTQERLSNSINSVLGANAFQKDGIRSGEDFRMFHATLTYIPNHKKAHRPALNTVLSDIVSRMSSDRLHMMIQGPVTFFGKKESTGKRLLGLTVEVYDYRIDELSQEITTGIKALPDIISCEACDKLHVTIGHVQIENEEQAQILKEIIRTNIVCNPYKFKATRMHLRFPGEKVPVIYRWGKTWIQHLADKKWAAARSTDGEIPSVTQRTPNPVENDAQWEDVVCNRVFHSDEESELHVPDNWEDAYSDGYSEGYSDEDSWELDNSTHLPEGCSGQASSSNS